jgi:hypothetical protein
MAFERRIVSPFFYECKILRVLIVPVQLVADAAGFFPRGLDQGGQDIP